MAEARLLTKNSPETGMSNSFATPKSKFYVSLVRDTAIARVIRNEVQS